MTINLQISALLKSKQLLLSLLLASPTTKARISATPKVSNYSTSYAGRYPCSSSAPDLCSIYARLLPLLVLLLFFRYFATYPC
jgi:hypothetical protein